MLTHLEIKNFKSIGNKGVTLELAPLTVLVGPNGSGKSTIFEAIALASQDFVNGDWFRFDGLDSIKHRGESEGPFILVGTERFQHRAKWTSEGTLNKEFLPPNSSREWWKQLDNFTLISCTRGDVRPGYGAVGDPKSVGRQGEHLVTLLAKIFARREYEHYAEEINRWMFLFGMMKIKAGYFQAQTLGSDYEDPILRVVLNTASSSAGSKQILTVITQLEWAPVNSTTIVEEPEISLHPQSQLHLADFFAEIVGQKKQVLITTHSQFLLMAFSRIIQNGTLNPEDLAIYHVDKQPEVGTTAVRLPISEKGYIDGWIPSFSKVEQELLRDWVDQVPGE